MTRQMKLGQSLIFALPRFALLVSILLVPLFAVHAVQAGAERHIEDNRQLSNGAGLVLVIGLQRV